MKCSDYKCTENSHCDLYVKYYLSKCVIFKKFPISWSLFASGLSIRYNKSKMETRIFSILQWKVNRM